MPMFGDDFERFARAFESDLRRVQNEFGELLGNLRVPHGRLTGPRINLWTNADAAVLTADVPGLRREDLEVTAVSDEVTIAGKRDPDSGGEGAHLHLRERYDGDFRRTVRLPFRIDPKGVDAKLEAGVLRLVLPREYKEKAHKVDIGAA